VPASQALLFPDPRPLVERLGPNFFRQLPERPGVYLMRDAAGAVVYVGKARNLRKRLNSYRVANPDRLRRRHLRLLRAVEQIDLEECADEAAALARESELLLALKPEFNRAGVWPARPRFHLAWRCQPQSLELAIAETLPDAWQIFGPFGHSIVHFRAALARLLWQILNPNHGLAALPCGWIQGRLDAVAVVPVAPGREPEFSALKPALHQLITGNEAAFVNWVAAGTPAPAKFCELEFRDADLETVREFVRTKFRRTKILPVAEAVPARRRKEPPPDLPWAMPKVPFP
jgi:predicted GIY-YIG superfamily endonuclease